MLATSTETISFDEGMSIKKSVTSKLPCLIKKKNPVLGLEEP